PTGVGKTTTIAKLAAHAVLRRKLQVALVTFDTYRIAAVDQLRTYGEILGAPVEVVLTPADIREKMEQLSGYDVIFVDSVGRSQQNMMQLSELKAFLEAVAADEIFLTISSTTQYEVMQEIVENYQTTKPTALVFTKLDEARRYGPLMNLLLNTGLPVAYLTNGQDVPDDLLQPAPEDLIQLFIGEGQA
ncbi:MAG: flagellar biosynthesis protein FlhF, partial [Firmicutes bacterium]|nr:flagellar biosynthesis protein FlhF [Bacillota bacterium]